jgi:peptidoglycan/xylan/chitin deacetylase (PgdA/CDA1 family)
VISLSFELFRGMETPSSNRMNFSLRLCVFAATAQFIFQGSAPAKAQLPERPDPSQASAVSPEPLNVSRGDSTPAPVYTGIETPAASPSAVATPPIVQPAPRKPTYNRCNVEGPFLAITFDDGPHPKNTPRLLDLLKERGVKATFYVIGQNVVQYPDIARRIVEEGHEIGNHSYTHPALPKLSPARFAEEITKSNDAIQQATGVLPTTMRPPYGAINAAITKRLNEEFQLPVILWSVDPLDWKIRKASHVSNHILQNSNAGAIVLAHDIHPSTIDAMPAAIDGLLAKGFQFVTVSELIAMDRPEVQGVPVAPSVPAVSPSPSITPATH